MTKERKENVDVLEEKRMVIGLQVREDHINVIQENKK